MAGASTVSTVLTPSVDVWGRGPACTVPITAWPPDSTLTSDLTVVGADASRGGGRVSPVVVDEKSSVAWHVESSCQRLQGFGPALERQIIGSDWFGADALTEPEQLSALGGYSKVCVLNDDPAVNRRAGRQVFSEPVRCAQLH
jgi:hypothetical protein